MAAAVSPELRKRATHAVLAITLCCPAVAHAQLRVIVNRAVPDADVSMNDLTRLFRGEYGSLANGQRVVLAEQAQARSMYAKLLTGMSDDQFKRHWIRVVFAGSPVQPPRSLPDAESACAFVARTPGALAIILGRCDESVRTLTVDSRGVNDAQYPLRLTPP